MPSKTITIAWTNGAPRFNPPPGVTHLKPGDTVTLQLTGVPHGGGSIDAVEIYANEVVDKKDKKGTRLCGWSRSGVNDCKMYHITPDSRSQTVVTIVDAEDPPEATKYWFSASGSPGDPPWSVDPELVNEPGGPG